MLSGVKDQNFKPLLLLSAFSRIVINSHLKVVNKNFLKKIKIKVVNKKQQREQFRSSLYVFFFFFFFLFVRSKQKYSIKRNGKILTSAVCTCMYRKFPTNKQEFNNKALNLKGLSFFVSDYKAFVGFAFGLLISCSTLSFLSFLAF